MIFAGMSSESASFSRLVRAFDATRQRADTAIKSLCYAPFVGLTFSPDGNASACCFSRSHSLGNVRQHRLEVYERESKPLLDYYRGRPTFRSINGAQTPERVAAELAANIDAMAPVASGRRI